MAVGAIVDNQDGPGFTTGRFSVLDCTASIVHFCISFAGTDQGKDQTARCRDIVEVDRFDIDFVAGIAPGKGNLTFKGGTPVFDADIGEDVTITWKGRGNSFCPWTASVFCTGTLTSRG